MQSKTSRTLEIKNNSGSWITYEELLTFLGEIGKDRPADDTKIHLYVSKVYPGEYGNDSCRLSITYEV